jgi:hypothetical protein
MNHRLFLSASGEYDLCERHSSGNISLSSTTVKAEHNWAVAASPALGATDEEMRLAFDPPPPPHPIVEAVRNLLEQRRHFAGSATELLDLLQPFAPCSTPKGVSQLLRNAVVTLADTGIELKFKRLHEGARVIHLREDQGDAYCKNHPPDASPDLGPPPQPTQSQEVPDQ